MHYFTPYIVPFERKKLFLHLLLNCIQWPAANQKNPSPNLPARETCMNKKKHGGSLTYSKVGVSPQFALGTTRPTL